MYIPVTNQVIRENYVVGFARYDFLATYSQNWALNKLHEEEKS